MSGMRKRSLLEQFEYVEETRPAVDMELFLEHVGQFGKWQRLIFVFTLILAALPGLITMSSSFVSFVPEKYRCRVPQCEGEEAKFDDFGNFEFAFLTKTPLDEAEKLDVDFACYKRSFKATSDKANVCSMDNFDPESKEPCKEYVYESQYDYSLIMQLNLAPICPDPQWPLAPTVGRHAFIGMMYMASMMVGAYLMGVIADLIGRKKSLLVALLWSGLAMIGCSFVGNVYWLYILFRSLTGIGSKGIFATAFTLGIEVTGVKYRGRVGILLQVGFSLGAIAIGILALFLQHWRLLELVCAALVIVVGVALTLMLSESPRWLIARHRDSEAKALLLKGARTNGSEVPKELLFCEHFERSIAPQAEEPLGVASLFSKPLMLRTSLVLFFNWISATMCYFGLSMGSTTLLPGSAYLNFLLTAMVELPCYLILVVIVDRVGRKTLLVTTSIVAGIACILAGVLVATRQDLLAILLSLLGKFGTTATFAVLYLYTAELYPTSIRTTAVGTCAMFSRLGGIVAPLLTHLQPPILPLTIMGVVAVVGGLLYLLLPETLGFPLPETTEEVELLFDNPPAFWAFRGNHELKAVDDDRKVALQEKHDRIKHHYLAALANKAGNPESNGASKGATKEPHLGTAEHQALQMMDSVLDTCLEDDNEDHDPEDKVVDGPHHGHLVDGLNTVDMSEVKTSTTSNPKSRKFSQMPPAPINSPQAVKVGNKFTAISRETE